MTPEVMASKVMQFINSAFRGAVEISSDIISRVPLAETAIMWAVFVSLAMGMLIIPIRGYGTTDLARAKSDLAKSKEEQGRREDKRLRDQEREAIANHKKSYEYYKSNRERNESYSKQYSAEKKGSK